MKIKIIFYFKIFCSTSVLFCGAMIPMFWTYEGVCPGFQSQDGFPQLKACVGAHHCQLWSINVVQSVSMLLMASFHKNSPARICPILNMNIYLITLDIFQKKIFWRVGTRFHAIAIALPLHFINGRHKTHSVMFHRFWIQPISPIRQMKNKI